MPKVRTGCRSRCLLLEAVPDREEAVGARRAAVVGSMVDQSGAGSRRLGEDEYGEKGSVRSCFSLLDSPVREWSPGGRSEATGLT